MPRGAPNLSGGRLHSLKMTPGYRVNGPGLATEKDEFPMGLDKLRERPRRKAPDIA